MVLTLGCCLGELATPVMPLNLIQRNSPPVHWSAITVPQLQHHPQPLEHMPRRQRVLGLEAIRLVRVPTQLPLL